MSQQPKLAPIVEVLMRQRDEWANKAAELEAMLMIARAQIIALQKKVESSEATSVDEMKDPSTSPRDDAPANGAAAH